MFLKRQATLLILAGILAMPVASIAESSETAPESAVFSGVGDPAFSSYERRVLAPGVAEYSFRLRVGSGPYDMIGLHRVVKETAPNVPAQAAQAVFLAHGDLWGFRPAFLGEVPLIKPIPGSPAPSLPVFLAQNGVDVWGIDFRWTLVPATETNFSFMQSWGIATDAADLGTAINAARFARAAGGNGFGQVTLLGWSRGGQIGYAYLNSETRVPARLRQVKNFIPADIYLKTDVAQFKSFACTRQQGEEATIAGGTYANSTGSLISTLGSLAIADPNGSSILNGPPFNLPGFTNREAGLLVGEATYSLQGGLEPTPFYHMTGGNFDAATGKPTGLLYTADKRLFELERGASPFQPYREQAEADASTCEQTDVPFDDHLADITVPVFYVGAGGGFGDSGLYTTTLLGSTDVTSNIVSLNAQRAFDFGHADLFQGINAQSLVWQPILTWLQAH
jgi:pimeloyl-ACP methyl ester carboxylesterase